MLQPPLGVVFYSPLAGFRFLAYEVSWSHTTTRHIRQDSTGRVISPSQRPLPDNIQHSQQTNINAPGGIRTHNLSSRAAKDLRLRPRGHWDRLIYSHYLREIRRQETNMEGDYRWDYRDLNSTGLHVHNRTEETEVDIEMQRNIHTILQFHMQIFKRLLYQ